MEKAVSRGFWRALVPALVLALLHGAVEAVEPASIAEAQARSHFDRGQRHYNVGDFDRAIDEFKRAYEISPAPGLLFNIAQAYRAKKDRDNALYFYTTYLREDPQAPERAYVEARMSELRGSEPSVTEPPAPSPPAPVRPPAAIVTRVPPPARDDPGHGLKMAGLITAAGGAVLIGTAAVFAVRAGSASDEVSQAFAMHQAWSPHLAEVYADGQNQETAAWIAGAVGAAALATGGVLYYLGARERPVSIVAGTARGGGSVGIRCAF
jgi:tetratricopeptide (TPR) repeat protein